jgi:uncharacterized protein (UPF0305 family)
MDKVGPVKIVIDMKEHVARSKEVLDELQRRINQMDHDMTEDEALRELVLGVTFDYLEAVKNNKE